MTSISLTPSAERGLEAAVVLLRETTGFMFLPLFVESERTASVGLEFLQAKLDAKLYKVAWPVDAQGALNDLRLTLLGNLDDAIARLPPNTVVVLDASGSVRKDLALETVAYINHRREPLRAAGLRLVLCWPIALKDELLSNAPDLWSVRVASPWIAESDLVLPLQGNFETASTGQPNSASTDGELPVAAAENLARWQTHRNLQAADLSVHDALDLASAQYGRLHWAEAAELAEAVVYALHNERQAASENSAVAVQALNLLGTARRQLGNIDGALQAFREASNFAQLLAKANPAAYEPDLAMSLSNLANCLRETGDRAGGLLAARKAVKIYTRLAKANPSAIEPDLALSINNLANHLSETGDRAGALLAAREAVEIYTRLAKANPTAYEPNLAASLNNLATHLSQTGDRAGALLTAREAMEIYTRLAQANPAAVEHDLAMSLNNLANRLSETGDRAGALLAAREVMEIYTRLAKANPAAYEPNLAGSINNLANRLSETGDGTGALLAAREAVEIYTRLAKANPAAYEPDLAMSINNLASFLSQVGDRSGAIASCKEALGLYEQADHQHPGLFDAGIARARAFLAELNESD